MLTTWPRRLTADAVANYHRPVPRRREVAVPCLAQLGRAADGSLEPARRAETRELRERLPRAVEGLPAVYREVVVLADVQGRLDGG